MIRGSPFFMIFVKNSTVRWGKDGNDTINMNKMKKIIDIRQKTVKK